MVKIDLVDKKETTAAAAPTTTMSRNKGAPARAVRAKNVVQNDRTMIAHFTVISLVCQHFENVSM